MCGWQKHLNTPIGAPWLTKSLHQVVQKIWNRQHEFVVKVLATEIERGNWVFLDQYEYGHGPGYPPYGHAQGMYL